MTPKLLLVSTCGTSVLMNGVDAETQARLKRIANAPERDLNREDARRLAEHAAERQQLLVSAMPPERRRLSAEMNGIYAALNRWRARSVKHWIIHTDTAAGFAAAEVVKVALMQGEKSHASGADERSVTLVTAPGLRTDDHMSFRSALTELTATIDAQVPALRQQGYTVIFNLTGGFKSVNAYLQALGMLYADRCVFLFETAPALLEIPRLPIKLAEADEVRQHLPIFRRLKAGYRVTSDDARGVPETLLDEIDGEVGTSVWGDVVWTRARGDLLGDSLLQPLSPKLTVHNRVRHVFQGLSRDRRVLVNEALDRLAAHLDEQRPLPKSNTLKKLQGDPRPPSTHEVYLWSDGSAWRLFGHWEEGGRFMADAVDRHL